ncbi:MAG: hypothetical protein AAF449_11240 [Myxococcota bacterium]
MMTADQMLERLALGQLTNDERLDLYERAQTDDELAHAVMLFEPLSEKERQRSLPPASVFAPRRTNGPKSRSVSVWIPLAFGAAVAAAYLLGWTWSFRVTGQYELIVEAPHRVLEPTESVGIKVRSSVALAGAKAYRRTANGFAALPWAFETSNEPGGKGATLVAQAAGLTQFAYGKQQLRVVGGAAVCASADPARLPKDCDFKDITLDVRAPDYRFDWMTAKVGTLGRTAPTERSDPMASNRNEPYAEINLSLPSGAKYVTPHVELSSSVREPIMFEMWGVRNEEARRLMSFAWNTITTDPQRPVVAAKELSRWDYVVVAAMPRGSRKRSVSIKASLLSFGDNARVKKVRLRPTP